MSLIIKDKGLIFPDYLLTDNKKMKLFSFENNKINIINDYISTIRKKCDSLKESICILFTQDEDEDGYTYKYSGKKIENIGLIVSSNIGVIRDNLIEYYNPENINLQSSYLINNMFEEFAIYNKELSIETIWNSFIKELKDNDIITNKFVMLFVNPINQIIDIYNHNAGHLENNNSLFIHSDRITSNSVKKSINTFKEFNKSIEDKSKSENLLDKALDKYIKGEAIYRFDVKNISSMDLLYLTTNFPEILLQLIKSGYANKNRGESIIEEITKMEDEIIYESDENAEVCFECDSIDVDEENVICVDEDDNKYYMCNECLRKSNSEERIKKEEEKKKDEDFMNKPINSIANPTNQLMVMTGWNMLND